MPCKMYTWMQLMSLVAMGLLTYAQTQNLTETRPYPPPYPPTYPPLPASENTATLLSSPPSSMWQSVVSLFFVAAQAQNQVP